MLTTLAVPLHRAPASTARPACSSGEASRWRCPDARTGLRDDGISAESGQCRRRSPRPRGLLPPGARSCRGHVVPARWALPRLCGMNFAIRRSRSGHAGAASSCSQIIALPSEAPSPVRGKAADLQLRYYGRGHFLLNLVLDDGYAQSVHVMTGLGGIAMNNGHGASRWTPMMTALTIQAYPAAAWVRTEFL